MADATTWEYNATTRRYRDTATGRFISASKVVALRDDFVAARADAVRDLAAKVASGDLSVQAWTLAMREEIRTLTYGEYAFGRGGINAMTASDNGQVGALCKAQYGYLQDFARDVADGTLSGDGIANRASLYAEAGTAAFHRGQTGARDLQLPQHPGDGQTRCLTRCKCSLRFEETDDEWRVSWVLDSAAEHCEDCERLASEWSPLVIPKQG